MNRFKHEIQQDRRRGMPLEDDHISGMQGPKAAFHYLEGLVSPEVRELVGFGSDRAGETVGPNPEPRVEEGIGADIVFIPNPQAIRSGIRFAEAG